MSQTHRYAVFGHPIAHSLSPRIHAAFGKQCNIAIDYRAIEAGPAEFDARLAAFARDGGVGANVTLPLKEQAASLCAELGHAAQRAGAANTLTRLNGGWRGDNTDGTGLVRDITGRNSLDLRGRRALMVGAGGAARGVAPALLDAGITEMVVVNRSPQRADALADTLGEPARVSSRYWEDLPALGDFDLIVNATSAARGDAPGFELPFALANRRTLAVDLNYGEAAVPFLAWARAAECRNCIDGLGMLVEQAAESFLLWHGTRPETDAIYDELRQRKPVLVTAD